MRSCCNRRSPSTAACLLTRSKRAMRLTHNTRAYIAASLTTSSFPSSRNEVERGTDRQDCDGIDDGGHRRPGQPEPQRREDHDEQRKRRVVGHEHEALLEPALEDDPGRGQDYVPGAEKEQPAPGNGSARHEPVVHQAIVQVKSGHVSSPLIRDLKGTMEREKAEMGLFITLENPTREMTTEAVSAGLYHSALWQQDYPRLQIRTIGHLLEGKGFEMPRHQPMYQASQRVTRAAGKQGRLG